MTTQTKTAVADTTAVGLAAFTWTEISATPIMGHGSPAVKAVLDKATKQPSRREQERAARQAAATVRRIGPGSWEVESATTPGTFHEVHVVQGSLTCTCPARGVCWHCKTVAPLWQQEQRRQARYDAVWLQEFAAPSLLSAERLAAARLAAGYGEGERVWGEEAAL